MFSINKARNKSTFDFQNNYLLFERVRCNGYYTILREVAGIEAPRGGCFLSAQVILSQYPLPADQENDLNTQHRRHTCFTFKWFDWRCKWTKKPSKLIRTTDPWWTGASTRWEADCPSRPTTGRCPSITSPPLSSSARVSNELQSCPV